MFPTNFPHSLQFKLIELTISKLPYNFHIFFSIQTKINKNNLQNVSEPSELKYR